MPQIAEMIAQLDENPARKQNVYVFPLENADAQQVEQILQGMFQRNTSLNNRNSRNQNSALINRSTTANQGVGTGTGFGGGGFGGQGGGGFGGQGGQIGR